MVAIPRRRQTAKELSSGKTVYGFEADMVAAVPGPLYHSAHLRPARVADGKAVVLLPRFDPEDVLRSIERPASPHVHGADHVRAPAETAAGVREEIPTSVAALHHHAGSTSPAAKRGMIDWWGPIIHEFYGSTESSAVPSRRC